MEDFRKIFDKFFLSRAFLIIALTIHIIFILSLIFGFLNPLFHDTSSRLGQGSDFFAIYQAGYNILVGLNPYEVKKGYMVVPYSYDFVYHPFLAYTMGIAFNIFPPYVAYWVWVSTLLTLIWSSCYLTHRICKSFDKPKWVEFIAIGMWLCFSPIYIELYMGQITLITGLLTFFSFYAEFNKKEVQSTMLWSFACLIKPLPYFLTPAILSSGRTRKVIYNILIFILSIISFGVGYFFFYYLNYTMKRSRKFYDHYGNFDFKTVLYEISVFISSDTSWVTKNVVRISIILMLIFIGLSILATIYSKDYLVSTSLLACSYFLAFSGVWEHHYTFLLPFLILLWIRDDSRYKWFLIFLFLAIPTPFYLIELFDFWYFPFSLFYRCSKLIPALVFFVLLLNKAFKTPRQEEIKDTLKDVINLIQNGLKKQDSENNLNLF